MPACIVMPAGEMIIVVVPQTIWMPAGDMIMLATPLGVAGTAAGAMTAS